MEIGSELRDIVSIVIELFHLYIHQYTFISNNMYSAL